MRSLLRTTCTFTGPGMALAVPVFVLWSGYVIGSRGWVRWIGDPVAPVTVVVVGLMMILVATAVGRRRAEVTLDHRDALARLVASTEEYCLILRPSGRASRVVVPDTREAGVRPRWTSELTLEQVVALAARAARDLPTYVIAEQDHALAPPGPTYLGVPGPDRARVARRLIARAHSIVLVLPPDADTCADLAAEIVQIVRTGRQHRVIVVLPPPDQDVAGHLSALRRAALLLAALRGSGRPDDADTFTVYEYELQLGPSTVVLKCTRGGLVHAWSTLPVDRPQRGAREVVAATSYLPALAEAITDTEHELRGLDFAVRYPG